MQCHRCAKQVEVGDRFCTGCGTSLAGVTDATEAVATVADAVADDEPTGPSTEQLPLTEQLPTAPIATTPAPPRVSPDDGAVDPWDDVDPIWAPTGSVPVTASVQTGQLPATEPITEVWVESVTADPAPVAATVEHAPSTTAMPVHQPIHTAEIPVVPGAPVHTKFRVGAMPLLGILSAVVTLVALFTNIVSVTSDTRLLLAEAPIEFRTGTWLLDDLGDNLAIAGLIAAVLMAVGGVAAGFNWRWGAGLAGGAGLSFAGLAGLAVGLAQRPIDAAHAFIAIPSEQSFTLTITRDLGYWLLILGGSLGVVVFFASVNLAFGDRRAGLNPWIAALGALAAVVAAAGPLLPERQGVFSDNWYLVDAPGEPPALLLAGRLLQLGLLAIAGVVGFLSVRRWGLGVAIGGALPSVWLAASTLFELGDRPVGPGYRNPGATDIHIHGVTIIGVSAVLAMIVLAIVSAYDQSVRVRR